MYHNEKIFILPSFYEGFGLPLLEAMACGTPVIGSNVSSIPEVIGDAGLLCDPHNAHDIAAKIDQLLRDADLQNRMRDKGLKRVQKFSWQAMAKKTLAVYEKAINDL